MLQLQCREYQTGMDFGMCLEETRESAKLDYIAVVDRHNDAFLDAKAMRLKQYMEMQIMKLIQSGFK